MSVQQGRVDIGVLLENQIAVFLVVQQSLRAKDSVSPVLLCFTLRIDNKINGNVGRPLEERVAWHTDWYSMTFGFLKEKVKTKEFLLFQIWKQNRDYN